MRPTATAAETQHARPFRDQLLRFRCIPTLNLRYLATTSSPDNTLRLSIRLPWRGAAAASSHAAQPFSAVTVIDGRPVPAAAQKISGRCPCWTAPPSAAHYSEFPPTLPRQSADFAPTFRRHSANFAPTFLASRMSTLGIRSARRPHRSTPPTAGDTRSSQLRCAAPEGATVRLTVTCACVPEPPQAAREGEGGAAVGTAAVTLPAVGSHRNPCP